MTTRRETVKEPTNESHEQQLQRLVDRTLRELRPRRAPDSLEAGVFAELQRRRSLPWWCHSFKRWPTAARVALVSICVALAALGLLAGSFTADLSESLGAPAHHAVALLSLTAELATVASQFTPPPWLSTALGIGAVFYAVLFGLGALAYRTLYFSPLRGR